MNVSSQWSVNGQWSVVMWSVVSEWSMVSEWSVVVSGHAVCQLQLLTGVVLHGARDMTPLSSNESRVIRLTSRDGDRKYVDTNGHVVIHRLTDDEQPVDRCQQQQQQLSSLSNVSPWRHMSLP